MFLILSKILSRSNCILILLISNLVTSAPLKPRKRSSNESNQGFSASPRILEIQLPLRIASKEDLLAWSKYVMTLMASKINFTSTSLKNVPSFGTQHEKRVSLVDNSGSRLREFMKKATSLNEKRQGVNYPARRLKEPPMQKPDDKVVAYPLSIGEMRLATRNPQDSFDLSTANINDPISQQYHGYYANLNVGNPFQQSEADIFGNPGFLTQPPAATYLPVPLKANNIVNMYQNVAKNASDFEEPAKLQNFLNLRVKAFNDELGQASPGRISDSFETIRKNLSRIDESHLAFPFQAVITITRQLPAAATTIPKMQSKDYSAIRGRNPPDEFPPYFERNQTLTNESGQINVIFDDFTTDTNRNKMKTKEKIKEEKDEEEDEEEEEQEMQVQKKKNEKKKKVAMQQKSKKRQSVLGDLLRTLGILRKPSKNTTEISIATPILSILRGTNSQKIQASDEEIPSTVLQVPGRGRRNETSQAQELNGDKEEQNENEDDEEEEGGSIQALIDLLPLAAPILEDLSDPESDTDIADVLQGAIPLLEGLSDPEEGGADIPGVLLPLSQRLSEGPEGEGSDSGAILGPIIQLIAPLIGPLLGPLIGPLSRTSSGPQGKQGSASIIAAVAGPLSQPGPYGQSSILSSLIASITARLSKELAASAGDSDVKAIVSSVVSGVLAGTSAGSSSASKGQKDSYYSPATYGTYHPYSPPPANSMSDSSMYVKEILNAFLKLSATSSTSSANLSGTSSSSSTGLSASSSEGSNESPQNPTYGAPPTNPPYASPPPARPAYPTKSSYTTFIRRQKR